MRFDVQPTSVRGQVVLGVRGELDIATAPTLAQVVDAQLATRPRAMILDLTDTTFLDSSGARQLALAARAADRAGTAVALVCPPGNRPVRLVLDLLELQSLVPVLDSAAAIGDETTP